MLSGSVLTNNHLYCAGMGCPTVRERLFLRLDSVRMEMSMNNDLATKLEVSKRLASLMQGVGSALWGLQELETTVATYLVMRVHAHRGIGAAQGDALLKQAEGRTLGALLKELAKSGVIANRLSIELQEMLEQRNWLVHRARRESRGILSNAKRLTEMLNRLESMADRSLAIMKSLAEDLERYVLRAGIDRAVIEREADRLVREWGLVY
jgi:hypothetical protein